MTVTRYAPAKIAAALIAFATASTVVSHAPARESAALREVSEAGDFRVRVSAALLLGRQRPSGARERLERALGDAHPAVRIAAASGLAQLGDAAAVPALERAAQREQMVGVKAKMQESITTLRQPAGQDPRQNGSPGNGGAPATTTISLDGKQFVLQFGSMRNNTTVRNERLPAAMHSAARSHAGGIRGAAVVEPSDTVTLRRATEKKLPVLLIDGQLNRLSQTKSADGTVVLSAQVELSLRRVPEQTLRGTLTGGASTQSSTKVLADESRLAALQTQVVEGAIESALRNSDRGLATAATSH